MRSMAPITTTSRSRPANSRRRCGSRMRPCAVGLDLGGVGREGAHGVLRSEPLTDLLGQSLGHVGEPFLGPDPEAVVELRDEAPSARWLRNVDGRTTLPLSSSECSNVPTNTCASPPDDCPRSFFLLRTFPAGCGLGAPGAQGTPVLHCAPPYATFPHLVNPFPTTPPDAAPILTERVRHRHSRDARARSRRCPAATPRRAQGRSGRGGRAGPTRRRRPARRRRRPGAARRASTPAMAA